MTEESLKVSEQQLSQVNINDCEVISPGHGISQAALRQSVFAVPENANIEFNSGISPVRTPASASTPSPLSWLQKCASRLFKPSPEKEGESIFQKQETEREENLVSERVLGAGIGSVSSAGRRNDYLVENAKHTSEHVDGTLYSRPVMNITQSQSSFLGGNKVKANAKGNLRVFRRTRSISAVVQEAKEILEVPSERENHESDHVKEPEHETLLNSTGNGDTTLNGEEATRDKANSAQEIDEEREDSIDNGKKNLHSGQKRRHRYSSRDTSEHNTEVVEIECELTSGGNRKRHQRETTGSPGLETLNGKRYNFRDSTIASMIAPRTTSAECKDKEVSHGEEQDPKNSLENNLEEVSQEPQEVLRYKLTKASLAEVKFKVLPQGKKQIPKRPHQKTLEEFGGELLEGYSRELTRVPNSRVDEDDQEAYSHELTMSETGELYDESSENEGNNDDDAETFVGTEQDDEDDDEEQKSLKAKLWNFLTT